MSLGKIDVSGIIADYERSKDDHLTIISKMPADILKEIWIVILSFFSLSKSQIANY